MRLFLKIRLQLGVGFVIHRFQPFVAGFLAGNLYGDVRKPAVRLGAVPVLDLRRNDDDRTGRQADGRLARLLIPALAGRTDQNLPAAGFGVMNVPCLLYTSDAADE